jgi:hypothetical protein
MITSTKSEGSDTAPAREVVKSKKPSKKKTKKRLGKPTKAKSEFARSRLVRNFPAATFEEAIVLAEAFQKFASGQEKVRRLALFDKLGKSADSGASRQLVTNSSKYGLTRGGYQAEFLELTPDGALATGDDTALPLKLDARFRLAIKQIEPFDFLYERCKGNKMPSKEFLLDALRETNIDDDALSECVDTFTLNAKYLGLLRTLSGTERLITFEHALEESGQGSAASLPSVQVAQVAGVKQNKSATTQDSPLTFENICFYISPIGAEESRQRKHADFSMEFVIEPALKEFGLTLVRADQIGKPGMISKQVLEHILKSKLVIADLSFHNPNVFYELCLRHVSRLPTVQLTRVIDHIPFDIDQFRTIKLDTEDLYSFMPKLQTYTAEIANQVRQALRDPDSVDNPISMYYPSVKLIIE